MRLQTQNVAGDLASRWRRGILLATPNGTTRDFSLPEPAIHTPPTYIVEAYHNCRRLLPNEYEIRESVPGSGVYDTLHILYFTPKTTSRIVVDYVAV